MTRGRIFYIAPAGIIENEGVHPVSMTEFQYGIASSKEFHGSQLSLLSS